MGRQRAHRLYPSDLTDEEWRVIQPHIPGKTGRGRGRGRPRILSMRAVLNALFYLERTGCQWDYLPRSYPKRSSVRYSYDTWRKDGTWEQLNTVLRERVRKEVGKEPEPSAAIIDSQSVKTTEVGGKKGYDAGKHVKGRKRHIAVDTLGLLLIIFVHSASIQDRDGACDVFQKLSERFTRLKLIWADGGYAGQLVGLVHRWWRYTLEIVKRNPEVKDFEVLPKRWIVERTFAWLCRNRRLSKDYERLPSSSETVVYLASIRMMIRRLAKAP